MRKHELSNSSIVLWRFVRLIHLTYSIYFLSGILKHAFVCIPCLFQNQYIARSPSILGWFALGQSNRNVFGWFWKEGNRAMKSLNMYKCTTFWPTSSLSSTHTLCFSLFHVWSIVWLFRTWFCCCEDQRGWHAGQQENMLDCSVVQLKNCD